MVAGIGLLVSVFAVLAVVGWFAFYCAEDKIRTLDTELREVHLENRRLRRQHARSSQHPSAIAARARQVREDKFADTLAAIKALPEAERPTLELYLNEADETVEFGGPL